MGSTGEKGLSSEEFMNCYMNANIQMQWNIK